MSEVIVSEPSTENDASSSYRLTPELSATARRGSAVDRALGLVFGAMAAPSSACGAARDVHLDLVRTTSGVLLLRVDGIAASRIPEVRSIAPVLEGLLVGFAVRTRTRAAPLHAASVALGEGPILLAGAKGSGKSTLALALARLGAGYLGDELTFVRYEDLGVEPFPKAATLKAGAFDLFSEVETHLDPIRGPVRYHLPVAAAPAATELGPPAAIVLPRFDPGADRPELSVLDPGALALELVQQLFGGLARDPRALGLVARLARTVAYSLTFPDLDGAIDVMRDLFPGVVPPLALASGRGA